MVDIHCHILPGVDDGAQSWETAIEMCRLAALDGITHIVATPHANHQYAYNREAHMQSLAQLRERIGGTPALSLGCDFHFSFDNVDSLLRGTGRYTIGDTSYLLVELSDYAIPPRFSENLLELMSAGFRPVITHPERNALLQRRPDQVLEWAHNGAVIQVTANSLTGHWGKVAQKTARWLLDRDAVHVIASDAHDTRHRPPLMSAARDLLAQWKQPELAAALVRDNPGAIVRNQNLPYFPAI